MSNIPYDAEIEYLESTGTQYIDTGFKPNQDTRIVATMQCVTSTSYGRLFGSGTHKTLNSVMIDYETDITGTLHIKYGNNSSWTNVSFVYGDYKIHTYDFNKNDFYIDRKLVSSNTYDTFQSTSNLGVFTYINGNNIGQNTEFFIGRLYNFQIYDNDILVRDYIPVRVNETGYLYDKVSKELFSNAGTGNFILGNDIPVSNININGFVSSFRRRLLSTYRAPLPNYLCFTALEDNSTITRDGTYAANLEYSSNGDTWNTFNDTITITLNTNDSVYFRGINNRLATSTSDYTRFVMAGKVAASGNIMSLLYGDYFEGNLTLPGTYCFYALFYECTALVSTPDMPATTLKDHGYRSMYYGCTNLTKTCDLPALNIPNSGYAYMFYGCTSLVTAPTIYATYDSGGTYSGCCEHMFDGCTSLVTASEFYMTNSKYYSFRYMYANCTSLIHAPSKIEMSTLSYGCFMHMFRNCTSLITAPKIKITTGSQNAFNNMFDGCTNLVNAQDMEFGTVPTTNYTNDMFLNCKNLIRAPKLPSTVAPKLTYTRMFKGCSKLNHVEMYAITISSFSAGSGSTYQWMDGVQNTSGVFVKHIDATWTATGVSGVPTNWTIIYYDPTDNKYYTDQTKATECDEDGNPI